MEQLKKVLSGLKKIHKLFSEIEKKMDRADNYPEVVQLVKKARRAVNEFSTGSLSTELEATVYDFEKRVSNLKGSFRLMFGEKLAGLLESQGMDLKGNYPEFKVSMFKLVVSTSKNRCSIYFGPDELSNVSPVPNKIAAEINALAKEIFKRSFDPNEFITDLYVAYKNCLKRDGIEDNKVKIINVLLELNFLKQSLKFKENPNLKNFKPYTRSQFGYDIYRLLSSGVTSIGDKRLVLHTAIYEQTKSKRDFLFVPESSSGEGSRISFISFKKI